MLCKAFPCRERVFGVRGPGSPLAGLGTPRGARAGKVGVQLLGALATRDTWALSRSWLSPSMGGEPSGQMGNLTALAGPQHQAGDDSVAPLHSVATGNRVRCVCSHLSQGVAAERQWGGAPREPAATAQLPALEGICGKTGPDLPLVVGSLENDLEFMGKRDPDICLYPPSTAPGPQ